MSQVTATLATHQCQCKTLKGLQCKRRGPADRQYCSVHAGCVNPLVGEAATVVKSPKISIPPRKISKKITVPPPVSLLDTVFQKFLEIRKKHRNVGAYDSEINEIIRELMESVADKETVTVPTTPKGWALYPKMAGSAKAAKELHDGAQDILVEIKDSGLNADQVSEAYNEYVD